LLENYENYSISKIFNCTCGLGKNPSLLLEYYTPAKCDGGFFKNNMATTMCRHFVPAEQKST
jgi:hypothetical protein